MKRRHCCVPLSKNSAESLVPAASPAEIRISVRALSRVKATTCGAGRRLRIFTRRSCRLAPGGRLKTSRVLPGGFATEDVRTVHVLVRLVLASTTTSLTVSGSFTRNCVLLLKRECGRTFPTAAWLGNVNGVAKRMRAGSKRYRIELIIDRASKDIQFSFQRGPITGMKANGWMEFV